MLVKEELVEYLTKGYIHVSRQDYLFFSNLVKIASEQRVTTGQNKLLDKLIDKYQRQLASEKLYSEHLKKLPWRHTLLESKPEYTQAHLSLDNNKLVLRSPYNKKFITKLKGLTRDNTFIWNKELKAYVSPDYGFAFRLIYDIANEIFGDVKLDNNLQEVLNDLQQYENFYWEPTLIESNGNYYIAAINEQVYQKIDEIVLDGSTKCLYQLSKLSVNANFNLTDEQKFAITYSNEFDMNQIDTLVSYIKNCEIKDVGILTSQKNNFFITNLVDKLSRQQIKVNYHGSPYSTTFVNKPTELIISITGSQSFYTQNSFKIVKLLNSTPINIK